MTYDEIAKILNSIYGAEKCAYYQWPEKEAPELPYLLFYYPTTNDEYADNKNHVRISELNVELYTRTKDFEAELTVEKVLDEHKIPYGKSEQFIKQENMYEVLYESEVVING